MGASRWRAHFLPARTAAPLGSLGRLFAEHGEAPWLSSYSTISAMKERSDASSRDHLKWTVLATTDECEKSYDCELHLRQTPISY